MKNNSIDKNRRDLLKRSVGIGAASLASATTLTGCDNGVRAETSQAPTFNPNKPAPWVNWAANQYCYPNKILSPENEDQLIEALKNSKGTVRAVGAGHSFSAVVPTNDTLISTDLLQGLASHNKEENTAVFYGGTRIHDAARLLDTVDQAFINLPDMDYPSLAGSVVNSVHGTGINYMSMSGYVKSLTLVAPNGEIYQCSANQHSDIFNAARTSIGSLGIITQLEFENTDAYDLTEKTEMADIYDVLDNIEEHFSQHRNFELFAFPLTSRCAVVKTDYAQGSDQDYGEEDPNLLNDLKMLYQVTGRIPAVGNRLYEGIIKTLEPSDGIASIRTGKSYDVLCHQRQVRFREMEYTVPVESGPACLKEILQVIKDKKLPLNFPIEYRHVKQDDIWLSMFEGMDGASISIHQHADWAYEEAFAVIEKVFLKYGGRPHWGKLHTLSSKELSTLYPKWSEFLSVRQQLDPEGKMLNQHMKKVFFG